jgi:hypothetical protein
VARYPSQSGSPNLRFEIALTYRFSSAILCQKSPKFLFKQMGKKVEKKPLKTAPPKPKAFFKEQRQADLQRKEREEVEQKIQQRKEEIEKNKKQKQTVHKMLTLKGKKGQPIMKNHMKVLLSKIVKSGQQ